MEKETHMRFACVYVILYIRINSYFYISLNFIDKK
jgi:hypothetical protein